MACDIRIASKNAQIGEPGPNIGIFQNFGGTQRLLSLVGPDKTKKLLLSEKRIDGSEIFRIGLVNSVVDEGQFKKEAIRTARQTIDDKSKLAARALLKAIQRGFGRPLVEGLISETYSFEEICYSENMWEGIRVFFEKRTPKFVNR
jgi:enoyl-CoA hydratase/carnithine racemase